MKHQHTHTPIHARILTKRARALFIVCSRFVELAFSSSLLSAFALCLLAPFAAAQRTKLAAFFVSQSFFFGKRYRNLMEFFLHLLLASSRFRVFVLQVFPLLQHNTTTCYRYL